MMLLGDFFSIKETRALENNAYKIVVEINPQHAIFKGHFPGNPIVPGVCLTQMVKEIVETILQKSFNMNKADNIKFTAIVNPEINSVLESRSFADTPAYNDNPVDGVRFLALVLV